MVGHLVLTQRRWPSVAAERERVAGMNLLRLSVGVPEGLGERRLCRRIDRGGRLLAREGVRRVLVPDGFSRWETLGQWGLLPVSQENLVQRMAAPLALKVLERQGKGPERATVALAGRRVSRALYQTALELCPEVRHLLIESPNGGGELAALLREEFGLPLLETDGGAEPDLVLRFGDTPCRWQGERLDLFGPWPALPGLTLDSKIELPPFAGEKLPFLSLLWEEGRLSPGDIQVNLLDSGL